MTLYKVHPSFLFWVEDYSIYCPDFREQDGTLIVITNGKEEITHLFSSTLKDFTTPALWNPIDISKMSELELETICQHVTTKYNYWLPTPSYSLDILDYLNKENRLSDEFVNHQKLLHNRFIYPFMLIRHIWLRLF